MRVRHAVVFDRGLRREEGQRRGVMTAKIWTLGVIVLTTLLAIMAVTIVDKYGPSSACEMSDC
jgi:hypothetical protein